MILKYSSDEDNKVGQTVLNLDLAEVDQYAREMSKLEKILSGKFSRYLLLEMNLPV